MNSLDFIILGIIFSSGLIGILRGLTKEILSLFTWGGAAFLTYLLLPFGRTVAAPHIANPMITDGVCILVLFITVLIILSIVSSIVSGYIRASALGGIDRSLGFGFGITRGIVVICIVELAFSTFTPRQHQASYICNARFISLLRKGSDTLLAVLPNNLYHMVLSQSTKQLEHHLKNQLQSQMTQQVQPQRVPPPPTISPQGGTQFAAQPEPYQHPTFPNRPAIQDPQKTADALATLNPALQKPSREKPTDYNQSQKRDMDRLFQTAQDDK